MKNLIRDLGRFLFGFYAKKKLGSYKNGLYVNRFSIFTKNTHVGHDCHFNGFRVRGDGQVIIGDHFHSGQNILVINSNHQFNDANAIPYDNEKKIDKDVVIDDCVWIGDQVLLLGGIRIGEGAIVQAGSVVVSDVEPFSIVGGSPAKHFKFRSIEQYKKLKLERKFT